VGRRRAREPTGERLKDDAPKLAAFRAELEALIAPHLKNNVLRQDFLVSRAIKC
jgi:hypothetical protein